MALMYSQMVPLGTPCPAFSLPGVDGATYSLQSFADAQILAVIIMCNHCPYVQAQWARMVALDNAFRGRGVQFVGVNANDWEVYSEDSPEKMKEYASRYGMRFPYLADETQQFARKIGAVCTPDTFVYDKQRNLVYRGRIDDSWEQPKAVTRHDLSDALEALCAGNLPTDDQQPSQGCSIKWKRV